LANIFAWWLVRWVFSAAQALLPEPLTPLVELIVFPFVHRLVELPPTVRRKSVAFPFFAPTIKSLCLLCKPGCSQPRLRAGKALEKQCISRVEKWPWHLAAQQGFQEFGRAHINHGDLFARA
jgi:hypothetical protein